MFASASEILLKKVLIEGVRLHHWRIEDLWSLAWAPTEILCEQIVHPRPMIFINFPYADSPCYPHTASDSSGKSRPVATIPI